MFIHSVLIVTMLDLCKSLRRLFFFHWSRFFSFQTSNHLSHSNFSNYSGFENRETMNKGLFITFFTDSKSVEEWKKDCDSALKIDSWNKQRQKKRNERYNLNFWISETVQKLEFRSSKFWNFDFVIYLNNVCMCVSGA